MLYHMKAGRQKNIQVECFASVRLPYGKAYREQVNCHLLAFNCKNASIVCLSPFHAFTVMPVPAQHY